MNVKQIFENILIGMCYVVNYFTPKNGHQIFFYSTPDFSDNAREIYEEIKRQRLDKKYKIIWAVKDIEKFSGVLNDVVVVKHRSVRNLYHFCRSKYIFRTHSLWGNLYVKNRQKMFVAWHGMPLKSLMKGNPKPYECDYLNTTSDFFKKELYSAVAKPSSNNPNVGLARNDLLMRPNDILHHYGYDLFSKVFLWMPTFRSPINADYKDGIENEIGIPILTANDLMTLNKILKSKNQLLILKLHPWSANRISNISYSNIVNLKDEDIMPPYSLYSLIGKVDVLITDYSSVYIDYLITGKPIWFVYDDIDQYRETRGFAFEPAESYMPGIKIKSKEALFACFEGCYDDDVYSSEREKIKLLFHEYYDDRSARRALEIMEII